MSFAQMDLQTLSNLFASTFSPDPNVQKMSELQVRKVRSRATCFFFLPPQRQLYSPPWTRAQLGGQEGMITSVLQIVGSDNLDQYVPDASFLPSLSHRVLL